MCHARDPHFSSALNFRSRAYNFHAPEHHHFTFLAAPESMVHFQNFFSFKPFIASNVRLKRRSHYSDNQSPTNDNRPITDLIFDRQLVADQLQTSRRPIANHSAIGRRLNVESSLKFENQSATGCHKINDWSATIRRLTARLTKEVLMLCINLSHPLFS